MAYIPWTFKYGYYLPRQSRISASSLDKQYNYHQQLFYGHAAQRFVATSGVAQYNAVYLHSDK